jgi:hypothetical protein
MAAAKGNAKRIEREWWKLRAAVFRIQSFVF